METSAKIYVAGHTGMVGSAVVRRLERDGFSQIVTRSRGELDLLSKDAVDQFFTNEKPDYVFLAAARVGGIKANSDAPATFLYENLQIQNNVITAAHRTGIKKLLFLGSSCIYPRDCPQPIKEDYLLTGPLEQTNEAYAIAKIAGIKLCQAYRKQYGDDFIAAMPTNLYGPNDNYDLETSHVLPALLRKFHEAKRDDKETVAIWGDGTPRREFLHVDDLADALVFLMEKYSAAQIINVGTGKDCSITELAMMIKNVTGFRGDLVYESEKPTGTPRKLLDVSRLTAVGWQPGYTLTDGIAKTYELFQKECSQS